MIHFTKFAFIDFLHFRKIIHENTRTRVINEKHCSGLVSHCRTISTSDIKPCPLLVQFTNIHELCIYNLIKSIVIVVSHLYSGVSPLFVIL